MIIFGVKVVKVAFNGVLVVHVLVIWIHGVATNTSPLGFSLLDWTGYVRRVKVGASCSRRGRQSVSAVSYKRIDQDGVDHYNEISVERTWGCVRLKIFVRIDQS